MTTAPDSRAEEVPVPEMMSTPPNATAALQFGPKTVEQVVAALPQGITLDMMFPEGGPSRQLWEQVTEVTVAPEGGWVPGLTAAFVQDDGVELDGDPEATERLAEQLAAHGIRTNRQVATDGKPLQLEATTASNVNQPWIAGFRIDHSATTTPFQGGFCTQAFTFWRARGLGRDWFHLTAGHCATLTVPFTYDPNLINRYNFNAGSYLGANGANYMDANGATAWTDAMPPQGAVVLDFAGYYSGFLLTPLAPLDASAQFADWCNNGTCQHVNGNSIPRTITGDGWDDVITGDPPTDGTGIVCKHGTTTGTSCGNYVGITPGGFLRVVVGVNQCGQWAGDSGSPVTQTVTRNGVIVGYNALGVATNGLGTATNYFDNFNAVCNPPGGFYLGYFPTWQFELYMGNGSLRVVNLYHG